MITTYDNNVTVSDNGDHLCLAAEAAADATEQAKKLIKLGVRC